MKLHSKYAIKAVILLLYSVLHSCIGGGNQPLSERFEAFVIPSGGASETLLGVRNRITGDTLIPPGKYLSAKADTNVIQLTLTDGRIRAYSDRGLPISPISFDSFIPIGLENSTEVFYLGTNRQERFYYFPKRHLTVDARHMLGNDGTHFAVAARNGDLQVYDFRGNRIWKAPHGSRVVFPYPNTKSIFHISIPGDTARYSPDGKRI